MVEEGQNEPDFPLKRITSEEIRDDKDEDRISRLPDCLLVEILSRLDDTKCAVKTGLLSRRWKHIWASVTNLDFSHLGDPNADFVSFVDKTLTQRGQLKLKTFSIYCSYNVRFEPQVRSWIRYAINCKVEEISMLFWQTERPHSYLLDQDFFTSSYFTDLNLTYFRFNPDGAISWEKLLKLRISHMSLDEDLIENIFSGSPVLETLELEECYGYRRLNITSKSVKKFVFNQYVGNGDVIEINAPNILSLEIQGHLDLKMILLINVSSLVEADLNYALSGFYVITRKEAEDEMLKACILKLLHVKEIRFGFYCLKALYRLGVKGFTFPSNVKVCDDSDFDDDSELSDQSNSDSDDDLELSDGSNSDSDDDTELDDGSDSDSDESIDSDVVLLDDGPAGDELQERVDATASSG